VWLAVIEAVHTAPQLLVNDDHGGAERFFIHDAGTAYGVFMRK
jgi:hypothetical protein